MVIYYWCTVFELLGVGGWTPSTVFSTP